MFKDTPDGQTHFCEECEVHARGKVSFPNKPHTCGKDTYSLYSPLCKHCQFEPGSHSQSCPEYNEKKAPTIKKSLKVEKPTANANQIGRSLTVEEAIATERLRCYDIIHNHFMKSYDKKVLNLLELIQKEILE